MLERKILKDKEKLQMLKELDLDINLILHDNNMPTTIEEAAAIHYFKTSGKFINRRMEIGYRQLFKREARRLFCDSRFNQVINYETDSKYWIAL